MHPKDGHKIEQDQIDAIKRDIDLVSLVESKGIKLTKNGKGYKGLCPFHEEKTPSFSITPETNLFHCFGCGVSGDNIRFIELYDHVDFKKAVHELAACLPGAGVTKPVRNPETNPVNPIPEEKARQLLERALSIYQQNYRDDAVDYLVNRGFTDHAILNRHKIGFCNNTLTEILPSDGGVREDLLTLGILDKKGNERFRDCLVFAVFDAQSRLTTLYGRSITESDRRHVFLPNRPTGLWNAEIINIYPAIILVESVIDAVSVEAAGFKNVIACQGTKGLTDNDIQLLKDHGVNRITLLFDGDEPGRKAAERLKEKLTSFLVEIKTLPENHDPNSFLMKYGSEKLADFIRPVSFDSPETPPASSSLTAPNGNIQTTPDGFVISYGSRRYQVIGLDKGKRRLKATVRLELGGKLHVDTLDFYSARARRALAQDICRIFNELPETIETDITRLMTACEEAPEPNEKTGLENTIPEISPREKKEAETLGKSPDLVEQILADFETCGLIGEEANKLLGYITMTSRKLHDPLSLLILSSSGAGKTALQDAITSFCPPEDLVKLTSLSGKALFYKDQNSLKHKVLAIEEGDGADEASYAIRSLVSSGVLITESTIKDLATGRLTTMENRVEGPTSVFYTTTNPETDPETASRFFVTNIDESRDQTKRILAFQRKFHMQDRISVNSKMEAIRTRHRNFQRLLIPLGIKNPYTDQLTYGDDRLQGRRDQPKYLALIKAVAFLRQMQKKLKYDHSIPYIEVDLDDIRIANRLAHEILGRSLDELSGPGRDLLMLLDKMVEQMIADRKEETSDYEPSRTGIGFTRRDIREFTGWANARVHRYIKELVDLEYVFAESGRNGSTYRYRLAYEGQGKEGEKFMLGLRPVEEIKPVD